MFTIKQSFPSTGVVATVGATIVLGTIAAAPATAALLNFNFSTGNGATGSFTLNTSIEDSDPGDIGLFQNAITDFEYSGLGVSEPLTLEASTPNPGPRTVFFIRGLPGGTNPLSTYSFYLSLDFSNLNLAEDLSDNPADYSPFSLNGGTDVGIFAGYGGGFELLPGGIYPPSEGYFFTPVTSVTVASQAPAAVTEPGTVLGLGLLGMWSLKRILSSLQRA
jgi:hypothetical protein